jgi:hypothetical protein
MDYEAEMVKLLIDCSFPIFLFVAAYVAVIVLDLRWPLARAMGCIFLKLCVVSSLEIRRYYAILEAEEAGPSHLWREIRGKKAYVIGQYVRQMACNTRSFQQAVRFDDKKIDPRKSSLEHDLRETLTKSLVEESAALRWQLYKCQVGLLFRATFRLNVKQTVLMDLLRQYKKLEEDFVALVDMAEEKSYRYTVRERLGLLDWDIIEGGANPA